MRPPRPDQVPFPREDEADVVMGSRHVLTELGDSRVSVSQLLIDRHRLVECCPGPDQIAFREQRRSQVVVMTRKHSLVLGD